MRGAFPGVVRALIAAFVLGASIPVHAALPLITDDAGTQGKGRFQIEVGGEYDRDRERTDAAVLIEQDYIITPTLTYGIVDRVDGFIALPYVWTNAELQGTPTSRVNGAADTVLGVKWRAYENGGLSLAFKPFVTVPTGNEEKQLGTGRTDFGTALIVSRETDPWSFHGNLQYIRNENKIGERKDLWHVSAAAIFAMGKQVKICGDIGVDTNSDTTSEVEPAYLLGGLIYALNVDLELSFAVKKGLSASETDWALLPGITCRF